MTGLLIPEPIRLLEDTITRNGGRAFLVGGASIDMFTGKEPKDWDIEVFGVSYERLIEIARLVGEADLVGSKFGVVKVKGCPLDIELSIPRTENKNGPKHQDFDITLKPDLSIKEAGRRRDFTINTIYIDLRTSKVIDEWGGVRDLHDHVLRYVDPNTFIEDPLRAFRAIQLAARKAEHMTPELGMLIKEMSPAVRILSGSAILGELTKCLMFAKQPSKGLQYLSPTGLIGMFPELEAIASCPQHPTHHPEGDVWTHTQMVVDQAAKWKHELPEDWQLGFMFGALLHDVGKPVVIDLETYSTICHDKEGAPLARAFMERITDNEDLITKAVAITEVHMRPRLLLKASAKRAAWRRLQNVCPLNVLAYVSMCDSDGRGDPAMVQGKSDPAFIKTMEVYDEFGKPSWGIEPILMGRHLIEAGYKPGITFSPMLKAAYEYQLEEGCTDIQELLNVATGK